MLGENSKSMNGKRSENIGRDRLVGGVKTFQGQAGWRSENIGRDRLVGGVKTFQGQAGWRSENIPRTGRLEE